MKKFKNSGQFKKGFTPWIAGKKGVIKNPLKGKKMPEVWRQKLRKPKSKTTPWTEERKRANKEFLIQLGKRQTGENSPRWRGGESVRSNNVRSKRIRNAEGSYAKGEWELLKKQYGYKCPCCNEIEPKIKLTADHIIPLSKGGSNYIENIQPLCGRCNGKKFTKTFKY